MAARKMTFTIPEDLASRFLRRVPARDRSQYVAEALSDKLAQRDHRLARACEIANHDADVEQIERDFDAASDAVTEPWDDVAPR